jgi:hypothetical protein
MGISTGSSSVAHTGSGLADSACFGYACMDQNTGVYMKQFLNTVANQSYNLSFWVTEIGGPTSEVAVYWDGNLLADVLNPANYQCHPSTEPQACNYVEFTYTGLVTSGTATVLQVNGRQDPGVMYFDDFSVTPAVAAQTPGSLALLGTGLLGGIGAIRRKFNH